MQQNLGRGGFDTTEMFKQGEQVFGRDLERQQAKLASELSSMGLSPAASDRQDIMSRNAGDSMAQFRLGQQGIAQNAFEQNANRQQGNAGMLGDFTNQTRGLGLQGLGLGTQMENDIFGRQLGAGQHNLQRTGMGMQADQMLGDRWLQQYGLGEQARGVADQDLLRQMGMFSQNQGGGLDQILKFMASQPGLNVGFGPSGMSQVGGMLGAGGQLVGTGLDIWSRGKKEGWW